MRSLLDSLSFMLLYIGEGGLRLRLEKGVKSFDDDRLI